MSAPAAATLNHLLMTKTASVWGNIGRALKFPFQSSKGNSFLTRHARGLLRVPLYGAGGAAGVYGAKHLDPELRDAHLLDALAEGGARLRSAPEDLSGFDVGRAWAAGWDKPKDSIDLGDAVGDAVDGVADAVDGAGAPSDQAKDQAAGGEPGIAGQAWDWLSERPEVYIPAAATAGSLGLYGLYRMLRSRDEDEDEEA